MSTQDSTLTLVARYREALGNRSVLQTPRLLLRRPVESDIPVIVAIVDDPAVAFRLGRVPHPYSLADARFFLDEIVPNELVWAVTDRHSGELVGMVGFTEAEDGDDDLELGYYIARPHWGRGYASEAGAAVIEYGLALAGPGHLAAGHFTDNPASGRVLAKLGFTVTGRSERHCEASGRNEPSIELRR